MRHKTDGPPIAPDEDVASPSAHDLSDTSAEAIGKVLPVVFPEAAAVAKAEDQKKAAGIGAAAVALAAAAYYYYTTSGGAA